MMIDGLLELYNLQKGVSLRKVLVANLGAVPIALRKDDDLRFY